MHRHEETLRNRKSDPWMPLFPPPALSSLFSLSKKEGKEEEGRGAQKTTCGKNRSTRGKNRATRGNSTGRNRPPDIEPCGFRGFRGGDPRVTRGVPVPRHWKKLCPPPRPVRVSPHGGGASCAGGCGGRYRRAMPTTHESRSAATRIEGSAWRRMNLWKAGGRQAASRIERPARCIVVKGLASAARRGVLGGHRRMQSVPAAPPSGSAGGSGPARRPARRNRASSRPPRSRSAAACR